MVDSSAEAGQVVEALSLPTIEARLVPDKGMPREGQPLAIFLKLWTIASTSWPRTLYRKTDWNVMDAALFAENRSESTKADLVNVFLRQWALARQLTPYDEDDWCVLRRLIQQVTLPSIR